MPAMAVRWGRASALVDLLYTACLYGHPFLLTRVFMIVLRCTALDDRRSLY